MSYCSKNWQLFRSKGNHASHQQLISHVDVAHGYFAYVNKISFAYPEHLVHEGVAHARGGFFAVYLTVAYQQ